jgi:demethylmenaquinone methyltransferase/2-methoxy-6-polyprenyl-1,4-benzoquinol methylase
MTNTLETKHAHFVRDMFARISRRYDLLNRLMTFGLDLGWRQRAVRLLDLSSSARILDVGAGTGDLSLEALRRQADAMVVAVDFTPEMMARARDREGSSAIHWVLADAEHLPFAADAFDGVMSGFLLRNLNGVDQALDEQARILRPAGRMVSLDAVAAMNRRRNPILYVYFRIIIPLLGRLVAGDAEAYNYLPASMDAFLSAKELADRMTQIGFEDVVTTELMFGSVAIHTGRKAGSGSMSQRED